MKALVISDKQEIIESLKNYLSDNNYDVIVYRWLLKALDNIEEIQPDIIFLSASEYPRHWKTLASFVQSGIGGNEVKLYLYDPEPLNDEEKNKAKKLGIEAFIDSLSIEELSKILPNEVVIEKNTVVQKNKYEMILTHPKTGRFIFSKALYDQNEDIFECNVNLEFHSFTEGLELQYVSIYSKDELKSFEGKISKIDSKESKIFIKPLEYYEEEI